MIARIRAAFLRLSGNQDIRRPAIHAAYAAVGVVAAAYSVGGISGITQGVIVAAVAAGLRVGEMAVVAYAKKQAGV